MFAYFIICPLVSSGVLWCSRVLSGAIWSSLVFSGVAELTELRKVKGLALRDPKDASANETYRWSKRDLSASAPGLLCVCVEERAEERSPLRHPPPNTAHLSPPHLRLLFFRLQDGMAEEGAYRFRVPPLNLSGKSRMAVRLAWRGDVVYVSVSKQPCPGAKNAYPRAKETCTAACRHAEHCCLAVHVPTGRQLQLPSAANMRAEHILGSLQESDNLHGGWAACVGEWYGGGARRVRCAPYSLLLLPVLAASPPAAAQPLGQEEEEEEEEEEECVGAEWRGRLAYEVHVYMPPARSTVSDEGLVQVVQMACEEEEPAVRRPPDGRPAHTLSAAAGERQDWHRAVGKCGELGGLMMVRGRECLVVYPSKRARTGFHERLPRTRKSSASLVCLRMRPLVCQCQWVSFAP
jgi:hypothetical protein